MMPHCAQGIRKKTKPLHQKDGTVTDGCFSLRRC